MYWLDLAIIYFAFGAPFGVFQITAKREVTLAGSFRIALGYVLWPLIAIQGTARFLLTKPAAHKDELETIRTELEKAIIGNASSTKLFAFREVFYRYTSLARAARETPQQLNSSALFNVAGNTNQTLRNACISRRDKQKLAIQLVTARTDLVEMITSAKTDRSAQIGVALANHLADSALIDFIHSR